ncbi:MAG: prolipoprotein diacylglyceryl transferase [Idiomarina sp.]|nr:prolipoprotein diacylglyceryl transferase [Idiomarina sp.]
MSSTPLYHPQFDPIIFSVGIFDLRWYGLMYLIGAAFAYWWGNRQADRDPNWNRDAWQDLLFWGFLALVFGGRIGYILFYQFPAFLDNPLILFSVTQGGMSFHGGLLGVLLALFIFAKKTGRTIWQVGDFVAPLVPIGLGAGRVGNFINGELWGRVTDVPWGMVFYGAGVEPRHPSQLYQAAGEGLLLFLVLWWFSRKPRPTGAIGGLFLLGYGVARFIVEYFREPDAHLGILGVFSMGQWLSLPMIIAGALIIWWAYQGKFYVAPKDETKNKTKKKKAKA